MIAVCSGLTFFPDCSRPSGLKSSLNHVHLKIYQASKRTRDSTDDENVSLNWRSDKLILNTGPPGIVNGGNTNHKQLMGNVLNITNQPAPAGGKKLAFSPVAVHHEWQHWN